MAFNARDENGLKIRKRSTIDCGREFGQAEQSHKDDVDVNNIIRKFGVDAHLSMNEVVKMRFDNNPNNDFHEIMQIINNGKKSFMSLRPEVRKQFDNDTSKFLDYVNNPDNREGMIELGLIEKETVIEPLIVKLENPPEVTTE